MRVTSFALVLVATFLATPLASADAPPLVPVQGYLTDAAGASLDGSFNIRFRVYGSPSGGTPLLEESPSVVVMRGRFVYYLGTEDALDLAIFRDDASLYLGVRVGNDPEATPLVELASIPFAAYSQYCGDATSIEGQDVASLRDYTGLTNVPATFPPSAHTHAIADLIGGQSQLQGSCPPGSSIRAIDAAGAITCEPDDDSIYTSGAGVVVNPDRSLSLAATAVTDQCFDTEAELHAALDDDYAALAHTHAASSLTGSFTNLTATGTVNAGSLSVGSGAFTSGITASSLTVTGAVTAATFTLPTPRVRRVFVPAGDFIAGAGYSSLFTVTEGYRATLYTIVMSASASAPVELPHGATITRITCYASDNNATEDFSILRVALSSRGNPSYYNSTSIGTSGNVSTSGTVDSAPVTWNLSHTVDAMANVYQLTFSWVGTTVPATQVGYFHGCEVVYSMSSL